MLGPLLFLCHINHLPCWVKSTARLFAQDCLLYYETRKHQDHIIPPQQELQQLEEWAKKWGMRFMHKNAAPFPQEASHPTFTAWMGVVLKHAQRTPYLGGSSLNMHSGLPTSGGQISANLTRDNMSSTSAGKLDPE